MKTSGAPKKRDTKLKKLPRAAYIWGAVTAVFVAVLFVLYYLSQVPAEGTHPLLLIYDRTAKDYYISEPAMTNSLKAASFEYEVITSDKNEIPSDISGRDVVIMSIGEDSFALMRDIVEDELGTANTGNNNILGYILVDPKYPGNLSVEKYDYSHPSCEVAMFGFGKEVSGTGSMGDVRRLFERMSGVDTVYGAYATRGSIISSRIYSSADQKRYLSLYDEMNYTTLLNQSVFQSELAGYLATTYGYPISFGSLNSWFVFGFAASLFGLAALLMFLFFIPVNERKGISFEKVGDDGMAAIVNTGLAIWFGVLIVAGYIIPYTVRYVRYIIEFAPLFMMFVMVLMRIGFMLTNKIKYKRDRQGVLRTLAAAAAVSAYFVACWLLVTGGHGMGNRLWIVVASAVLDLIIVTLLGYIDKKSRSAGENGCSYFGNIFYPIQLLIPAGAAVVVSFFGFGSLNTAVCGLLIVAIPFVCSNVVKRISDNVLFAGLVHGLVFALLLL